MKELRSDATPPSDPEPGAKWVDVTLYQGFTVQARVPSEAHAFLAILDGAKARSIAYDDPACPTWMLRTGRSSNDWTLGLTDCELGMAWFFLAGYFRGLGNRAYSEDAGNLRYWAFDAMERAEHALSMRERHRGQDAREQAPYSSEIGEWVRFLTYGAPSARGRRDA